MEVPDPPIVHIWVPDLESAPGGIQSFSRFFIQAISEILPGAKILVLSKNDSSIPDWLTNFPSVRFDCAGWWTPGQRTAAYARQLAGYALRERPSLILSTHVNFVKVARWLKVVCSYSYSAVAHGIEAWGLKDRGLRKALHTADRLFAVSNFTRNRMIAEIDIKEDQIGLLPNTFRSDKFSPFPKPHYLLKRFKLTPDQPVILTVARLASEERYKGYDQVLRALPQIRRVIPNVRYILGGRGPDRLRVEALVDKMNLKDCVTLAGYIPEHELAGLYNLSDVFAMPSKGEGFGIVFLEALACGKPVIAGNKDGSVDAVMNGRLGVLVDPDNVGEIEKALIQILCRNHPLEILKHPDQLRAQVIELYGYETFVETLARELTLLKPEVAERVA